MEVFWDGLVPVNLQLPETLSRIFTYRVAGENYPRMSYTLAMSEAMILLVEGESSNIRIETANVSVEEFQWTPNVLGD